MIFFVAPADGTFGMQEFLQQDGNGLLDRIKVLTYEEIASARELALGSYVFSALDQLSPTERQIISQSWRQLSRADSDIKLINHPAETLGRYELLKTCFEQKRNNFAVYRASQFLHCRRFPVFLRPVNEHTGSLSALIYTPGRLTQVIAQLLLQGYCLRDLLIVEYCDTADSSGLFRKYSGFRIGKAIIPHTIMHSHDWVTKASRRVVDIETAREELEFVETNPHANWLRDTFELARIGYGRIDYGLRDGAPQVWEINTNPTIVRRLGQASTMSEEQRKLRAPSRECFVRQLRAAWESIDSAANPTRTIRISVSPRQEKQLQAEKQLRLRLRARRTVIGLLARAPIWLYHRLQSA